MVLRVLGIGKIGFCCKKILPEQETVRPQTSQDPTIQHMTKSQDAAAVVLRKKEKEKKIDLTTTKQHKSNFLTP